MRDYFPLDAVTAISFSGKDRLKWLNNLVTNDLKPTTENRAVECFVTDVKGRTFAHGIVFADQDSLVFFSWGKDQAAKLLPHFDRYIIREDVTLVDESSRWRWMFVSRAWLTNQLKDDRFERLNTNEVAVLTSSPSSVVIAYPAIGEVYGLVRYDQTDSVLNDLSIDPLSEVTASLQTKRIRQRWPVVGIDFDEKNLPQELDRNSSAISFNKGCYLGQETVARLDALGQVQKKLVLLSMEADPSLNSELIQSGEVVNKDQQEAGTITSVASNEDGSGSLIALAYIRRAFFAVGTELNCNGLRMRVLPPS